MKLAFISDIHGNAIALKAVLQDIEKKRVDKIYVLGDLCYRGPEPKRSVDLVRSLHTDVIKGNADEWVVRGVREGEVPDKVLEIMNVERDWTVSLLDETDLDYLDSLPNEMKGEVEGIGFHAFHATPSSLFDVVLPSEDDEALQAKLIASEEFQIYIYAHIHKPYIRYLNGKVVMNIGSVGLPLDGLTKSSYGIVEINDGNFSTSIERIEFDFEKVMEKYKEVDYPNEKMVETIRTASA